MCPCRNSQSRRLPASHSQISPGRVVCRSASQMSTARKTPSARRVGRAPSLVGAVGLPRVDGHLMIGPAPKEVFKAPYSPPLPAGVAGGGRAPGPEG